MKTLISRIKSTGMILGVWLYPLTGVTFEWQHATPESQGMSGPRLEAFKESLSKMNTKALLVIRNDRIVYEWHVPDHSRTKKHYTASMAKALVGGVSLAVAIGDGKISVDDHHSTSRQSYFRNSRCLGRGRVCSRC